MFAYPLRTAALAVTAIVGLSACTTPYGYSGVSLGVGNGYYDPYYASGYGGYGYGAGYGYGYPGYGYGFSPYWGWNNGFYYPGTGFYVYDRYRHRHRWTDAQRRYWEARRERALATSTTSQPVVIRDNWDDFRRDTSSRVERQVSRQARPDRQLSRQQRIERQQDRVVRSQRSVSSDRAQRQTVRAERSAAREERQATRELRRSEVRSERTSRGNGRGRGAASDD